MGKEGMFPASYTRIMVPLDSDIPDTKTVLALFTFRPESWDDLPFQVGLINNVVSFTILMIL